MGMVAHKVQLPNVAVTLQVLSEVTTAHELENEAKRVFKSGVNSNERHDALVTGVKVVARQRLLIQSLQVILSDENAP